MGSYSIGRHAGAFKLVVKMLTGVLLRSRQLVCFVQRGLALTDQRPQARRSFWVTEPRGIRFEVRGEILKRCLRRHPARAQGHFAHEVTEASAEQRKFGVEAREAVRFADNVRIRLKNAHQPLLLAARVEKLAGGKKRLDAQLVSHGDEVEPFKRTRIARRAEQPGIRDGAHHGHRRRRMCKRVQVRHHGRIGHVQVFRVWQADGEFVALTHGKGVGVVGRVGLYRDIN